MNAEEKIVKHLEMIQQIIIRMANCSFLLKGWSITLATAGIWISTKANNSSYICILVFPTILFWILDGYFLNQERLFRQLYNSVRQEKETDFSMKICCSKSNWLDAFLSKTIWIFYVAIIFMYLVCGFILKINI